MVGLLALFAVGITLAGVLVIPTQPILAYVLPVAAAALLLALFYGFPAALVGGISLTALYALAAGGSFELFFIHLAAILVILPFARRINRTVRFLQAGAGVALVVFIGMIAFSLLSANFSLTNLPKFLLAAGLNGALTASVVFAGAAFLGSALGITTFLQLLELENPRQGLLRRLAGEAPGTYSHSLRMAGLVEAAAERIGADALLARVQALYHDIGKTAMPEYFVENQRGTNPHLKLTPKESAEILRAHVSEGLALAAAAGLPEPVAAAIPEHHGTSLMAYFWETAKKRGGRPRETDFRYLGPKPHSKETAIIMLADAVESASRTLERPDEDSVKQLIHRLFTDRIDDGQLDDAPLQSNELTVLKASFAETILADLHKRIAYPERKRGTDR
jgi:putative nucleotidyltransferase with HDIG domain